jgi:acetyl esterase/lipase
MINHFMKKHAEKATLRDLDRIALSKLDSNIKEVRDISYLNDRSAEHQLDVYYQSNHEPKPVLIDIHGGGFISGDKKVDALFANCLAQRGFVVFALNYRLAYPEINVFDQIEDISNGVKWILSNAEKYEGNVREMYIAGHSAGGVLAVVESLLCDDQKMRDDFHVEERNYRYQGMILDCGLMHFYTKNIAYWGMRNMIFPKGYRRMDQYQYLIFENNQKLSTLPKTVLLTNQKDSLKRMTHYFKRLLDDHHVDNKLFDSGADGHMGIVFNTHTEENQEVMDHMREYFGMGEISR